MRRTARQEVTGNMTKIPAMHYRFRPTCHTAMFAFNAIAGFPQKSRFLPAVGMTRLTWSPGRPRPGEKQDEADSSRRLE